ncbi:pyrimidine-nucleoside phosphorylase [Anaeromyxobacter dehalogenans 2CP-1]|uniref:thymidine phosphorylase n=1 Tax=Anaeromyxobacter dehalogenans (strain ATCC BAA-258 / DSM 21875 / 2CP-1) TaxID=455488 RepID=B8JCY0_ANAD2|nr:thymidine phosphorylase [Anaeromyxobacter dehalogenans]ACL64008.1 pyrimidine-nucleoside phosphorylase [Anaeromyxobacter dehalogenans 2CP-1]
MRAYEIIHAKRDGRVLPADAIAALVDGFTHGEVPDYQMAAFCMAVFFRGMDDAEVRALTEAMLRSGDVLDLSDVPGAKVDKHSTGGVGDKVSLALAPLAAACGVKVPMISGRGLGHTGGTLDKLEAIPGFRVDLPVERFRAQVRDVGACLIGQTARLAPADRKLYALRDVTATVESIPLIAASIMSKKLAEGIDALVLDVKVGSGAFMKRPEDARALARTLAAIGRGMGKRVTALLTGMDQPLGRAVGNALEVAEVLELLRGGGPADLRAITVELTAEMLLAGGVAPELAAARAAVEQAIGDGRGLAKLEEIVAAQGGDPAAIRDPSRLPRAAGTYPVPSPAAGFVQAVDTEAVGLAAVALGAGRARVDDPVDPAVGILVERKLGDRVERGEPLCVVHHGPRSEPRERIAARLAGAYRIGPAAPPAAPLFLERLT